MRDIKEVVKDAYAQIASKENSCCCSSSCCDKGSATQSISKSIGYTEEEISSVPEGADLGLGCGNPVAIASLKEGEVVLDLGSGAGFDCFLAASKVGDTGKVIGVDMTSEMIAKARANARNGNYNNVEFRLGEIENLPIADKSVDVVLSNCVINLVPNKERVFQETFRVLKPGGRIMISDIVLLKELPDVIKNSVEAYVGCISGAVMKNEYMELIKSSGFSEVKVVEETSFSLDCMVNDPTAKAVIENSRISLELIMQLVDSIVSIRVSAVKM